MKKLIFTIAIILGVATAANAQDNKFWVGGTVGLWSSHVGGEDSELSFKVLPEFGYVINDNVAVGISLGGGHTHTGSLNFKNTTSGTFSANFYRVNPFVRVSFLKGSLGSLFVDGGVAYEHVKACNSGDYGKANGIDVGFKPGVALNVSDKVVLLGKFGFLGYEHVSEDGTPLLKGSHRNSFGFDFNLENIELGAAFKF